MARESKYFSLSLDSLRERAKVTSYFQECDSRAGHFDAAAEMGILPVG